MVAQRLRRDELGLADDPVERAVLRCELEVAHEPEQLGLGARAPVLGADGHRAADAAVQVADELLEDLLLAREVEVERPLRDAGGLGDLDDRRVVIAELGEDALGRLEQALARRRAAARELLAVHAGRTGTAKSVTPAPPRVERAQLVLQHLVHRRHRQRVDEAHALRHLVAREPLAAVRDQRLVVDRLGGDHERDADLAPALVGHADDRSVGDAGVLVQHALDLGRIHVLAAGDVHVLEPAEDAVVALVVELGHVAGVEPAVAQDLLRRLGIPPVAGEDVRPPHLELPSSPSRVSTNAYGLPAEPSLRIASSGGRQRTFGAASVSP